MKRGPTKAVWMVATAIAVNLLITVDGAAVTPPDNKGTEFILMFMENQRLGPTQFPLELYCTTQEKKPVHVQVTSPKFNNPAINKQFTVTDGQVQKVIIDGAFRMSGTGTDTKGILVTADKDVACYGANKETLSNDVFLGLPTDALGTDYYAMVHSPPSVKTEIGIASTADNTDVFITLPSTNGPVDVTFQGKTYHAGETIQAHLDKYETLQVQSNGDLTGAHIQSNHPIAAFSGNVKTNVGKGTFSDHLVEQLVSSDRWGEKFVTAPIPGRTVGDVFRVVAKEDGTDVTIPNKPTIHLNKGESAEFELPSGDYNYITSSKPIMLAQFVKSQQSGTEPADPSMMIIPPYEQFGSDYTFTTPEYSHPEYGNSSVYRYKNEFMIVAKKSDISGLLLDGKPFPQTNWIDIPGTNLVGAFVTLPHGPHTVRHTNPLSTFGGYLYGHAYHESYGFPTGMRTAVIYDPNCKPTPSVPGDGIDNDCDNKIDEELCGDGPPDDDKDGRNDEDCVKTKPIDGLWGNWGPWSSACSVTCGDGVSTRTRKCDSPAAKFGGLNCTGIDQQTKKCYSGTPCTLDVAQYCRQHPTAKIPNPTNCAQYYDCTKTSPLGQLHLFECPYPDLFNNNTLQCDNFENVNCGRRMEPKDPCDYLQNKCNGSDPACLPCRTRWPSCVNVTDGRQPLAVFAPQYKDCKKDRTMGQGKCDIGFFDSRTHQCVNHNPGSLGFYCRLHHNEMLAEPHNCAKYYDCSKTGRTLDAFISECKYPDLFDSAAGRCRNFTSVACKTRTEPEAPCEYDQNKCSAGNTTCKPCPQVHANCRSQPDGPQAWPGKMWGPDYVDCYINRTMKEAHCTTGYYHPLLKTCTNTVKPSEVTDVCKANPTMIFPDPQNCAKYINCSAANTLLGNHMVECTYPDLFSMTTMTCQRFDSVTCDKRHEPMAPCEYDQNKCPAGNTTCRPCPDRLPSCVGLADGNQPFPTRMWKPDYVTCDRNRTVIPTKTCSKGYFHPVTKQCTDSVTRTDVPNVCQANPTMIFPDPQNCAKYINCSAANTLLGNHMVECTYPDLFSMTTMMCQRFDTVTCDKRHEPMAPCEYDQNKCPAGNTTCRPCPDRLPSCVGLADGNQPFPTRMWKPDYVTCDRNRTVIPTKTCSKGYFHPVTKQCTDSVTRTDVPNVCQANPTMIFPDPQNCAKYINCSAANTLLGNHMVECTYPDLFSMTTMMCQRFDTVTCDKRHEPMAPCEYDQNKCPAGNTTCRPCPDRLPSCVGLADGKQSFPTRMWKPDYVTCDRNRTVIPTKTCSKGYFHPVTKQCTDSVTRTDAPPFCQANPTAVMSLPDNCAEFINCSKVLSGSSPVVECHYPDLFSTQTMRCQDFSTVQCDKRHEPMAPCEYKQNQCPAGDPGCLPCIDRLPSCVGQPDGDTSFPNKLWKPDYVTCYKNRTVIPTKQCTRGYFHPQQKQCTEVIAKTDANPYCKANPNQIIAMPDDCAQYIDCTSLTTNPAADTIKECKYPDLFSSLSMTCQDFTTVQCDKRPEPMAPCEYKQNLCSPNNATCEQCPLRLPSCIGLQDGAQPFPTRLWSGDYVECYRNRTMALRTCVPGTIFDPKLRGCVSTVPTGRMGDFCKTNPNSIKPDPTNCARYFNCSQPNTTLGAGSYKMECRYPDLFSATTLRCQQFDTVNCDHRMEPKAPCEYAQNLCNPMDPACVPCPDRLPSCVALGNGAQPAPNKPWSRQYVSCNKERTMAVNNCTTGHFNPRTKMCSDDVDRPDAKPYCQANRHDTLSLKDNCAQYINCSAYTSGRVSDPVQECSYPQLFDKVTMMCRDFHTVSCGTRPEPQAPCEYDQYNSPCNPMDPLCPPCQDTLPSCKGLPDGDQPFPSRLWKPDYITCYQNRTVVPTKKCTQGYFHPINRNCTQDITPTDSGPYCRANPRDTIPMMSDCAKYYNCTATLLGQSAIQECHYPDLFSTVSMTCQDFTTVTCNKRPEPQAPCEYDQNQCPAGDPMCAPCPDRLPSCVNQADGQEPDLRHQWTDVYVECYQNRTLRVAHCPSGAVFSPSRLACINKIGSGDIAAYCQANPSAIKPHETNCAQYYNCSHPQSKYGGYLEECAYPDLFSTSTLRCENFETVPCGTRHEPQPPCEYLQNRCDGSDPTCKPCHDRMPSCVGLADGKNPVPGHEWSPDYLVCYKNRTMNVKHCNTKYFHPVTKTCTDTLTRPDVQNYCQKNPSAVLPADDNCAQYYNCSVPTSSLGAYVQECKYPNLFDSFSMTCGAFMRTLCGTRPEPQAPCEYEQNLCPKGDPTCVPCPDRLPSCRGLPDGAQADSTHPWGSRYVECFMNRTMVVRNCTGGYFHPRLKQCRAQVDPVDAPDYCAAHPGTVLENPDNCAVFYNCSKPHTDITTECTYPDLYDTQMKMCQPFEQVNCLTRPEPKAPCQYKQNQCSPTDVNCIACQTRLPSCVGMPDGNQPVMSNLWGTDYVACYKNRTMDVKRCIPPKFFNPQSKICSTKVGTNDFGQYCDAHPKAVIPHPDNCAKYVNCSEVTMTTIPLKECTYPDLFSTVTLTCMTFTGVSCDTRMEPQAPCEYDQNTCSPGDMTCSPCPQRLPSCVGTQDGARPFTGKEWTENYIECFKNRTMALNKCPTGSIFEPYQASCVSRIDKNSIQSYCHDNPQAMKAHPDNCALYYNCSQPASPLGPFLLECPYPQLFDETRLTCVDFELAQCGRKTEPKYPCDYLKNLCSPTDSTCIPCSSRLPSCEHMPDGNQPYPGKPWEADYITCRHNRTVAVHQCQLGFFHPQQKQCVTQVTPSNIASYCPAHSSEIIADPTNCARYFNCSNPQSVLGPYVEECPYPQLFSDVYKTCVQYQQVSCQTRHEPTDPCEYKRNLCSPNDPSCVPCRQRFPSCQGLPDGAQPYPGRSWEPDYITCSGNRTISTDTCPAGHFNPRTKSCEKDVQPVDIVPYCHAHPQAVVVKTDQCAQYYLCTKVAGNVATVDECKYPDLFDRATLQCQQFETVDCDKRPEPQAPCDYARNQCPANTPSCTPCVTRLPSCVGHPEGFQSTGATQWGTEYLDCHKNRTMSVKTCPQGSFFSSQEKRCTQNINTGDIASFCQSHPTAIRAHPTNCAQYYDCSASVFSGQQLKECPYPDLFDKATLTCQRFTNVTCGIRYEPKAPCDYKANQCPAGQLGCVPCPQRLPSCVGQPDGNQPVAGSLWQQQYVACDKDRTTSVERCTSTRVFNPNTKQCVNVQDLTKPEIQDYCRVYPNAVIADPDDCSRYFQCSGASGTGAHMQCTYPMLFSDLHGRCEQFNMVDCKTRKEPTAPCEYDHNHCPPNDASCIPCQIRMPDCDGLPDGDNGIKAMLWSLNYIRCQSNRTMEVKRCSSGVFDPNIHACSSHVDPSHIKDLCFANPTAIVPHPTNCAQYFDCSKPSTEFGHYLMECRYPMLFDEQSLSCRSYTSTRCGTKNEPKAPCEYFQNLCPVGNTTCVPCGSRLPSCKGLPDGLNPVPSQSWSPQYMTCDHERTLAFHRCPSGVFDPQRRSCSQSVQPVDIPKYCQSNPTSRLADPSTCHKYYDCADSSNNYLQECKYPQLYSEQKHMCDDFRQVSCGQKHEPQSPCEYDANLCSLTDPACIPCPQRLPSCSGLPDGINGAVGLQWTSTYVQCLKNRTMVVQHCRQGIFDPNRKQCVKDVDPSQMSLVCQANPTAVYPDPTDCAKYYDCRTRSSFNQPQYSKECSYPDLFDTQTNTCQNFTTVYCNNRPEPQAPCEYVQNQCVTFGCRPCPDTHPSCRGLPDGYNGFPGQPWSQQYMLCLKNRTLSTHNCATGLTFDPTVKKCSKYVDPAQIPEYCKTNPQAVVPSTQNAAQYFDCSQPQSKLGPYKHECNYPDLFDVTSNMCKDFTTVPPDSRRIPQAPCEYENNRCTAGDPLCKPCPQRLASCVGLPDGPNAVEGKQWTAEYVNCRLNRTLSAGHCDQGVFNPNLRQCEAPKPTGPMSIADQCKQDPSKMISDDRSCSLYYNCSNHVSTLSPLLPVQLMECVYPKLYSTVYHQCLDFQYVQCDNRHEVMAPCSYLQNQCDSSDPNCRSCPERLPSCIGLPDGDNPVNGRYWKPDYITCYKDRTMDVKQCSTGYFNPETKQCSKGVDNNNLDNYCRSHPTAKVANSKNCAQYFDCSKSTFRIGIPLATDQKYSVEECHYPDLFDATSGQCESFERVRCADRPEPQAPCEYDQNACPPGDLSCAPCPSRLPSCVGLPDGQQGVPGQEYSDTYLECRLNRTLAVHKCDQGFFDAGLHICVKDINSGNAGPYCQRNPGAILPHPTNCAWFYNCSVNGITRQSVYPFDIEYVQECPYPQLFSAATMSCEAFKGVSCDKHFEPQAPCEYFKNRCDPTQQNCIPCPNRLPSCKNLPDGQQVVKNLYDNLQYLVNCDTNRTLASKVCTPGSLDCIGVPQATTPAPVFSTAPVLTQPPTTQPQGICDVNRGRIFSVSDHCGQYYNCSKLYPPYKMECPYPQEFSDLTGRCQDFQTVDCARRTEFKQPCDYEQNHCSPSDFMCTPCYQRLPSCLNLPDGDQPYPGKAGTRDYVTCLKGRTMHVGQCPSGTFDPYYKRCSIPTTQAPVTTTFNPISYCAVHPTAKLPDPVNCHRYYDCSTYNTVLGQYRQECPYPEVFDATYSMCRDAMFVSCGQRKPPTSQCDYLLYQCIGVGCQRCPGSAHQTEVHTHPTHPTTHAPVHTTTVSNRPSCTGKADGLYPYPGREYTDFYIVCEYGRVLEEGICIVDKIFDPVRRRCSYPADSDVIEPYCRHKPGVTIPSVTNCAQYYQCGTATNGFQNVLKECTYPQLFSTIDNTCKSFHSVQCGQRSEPVIPCDYNQFACTPGDYNCIPCDQKLPSCNGLPDGLNAKPGTYQSPEYITCDMGRTVATARCPVGYFDANTRQCITGNVLIGK